MKLKPDERIDDLQINDLKIIQNKNAFCFGIDAVLLSFFTKTKNKDSVIVDLCSGTGIIPLLLTAKVTCKKIIAIEIQKEMAEMAQRSVELNNLQDKIEILNRDLNEIDKIYKKCWADVITVNPPYKKSGNGVINSLDTKTISRHEVLCTLEDIMRVSYHILKPRGSMFMVHRTERLVDVLAIMRNKKIEPKRIQFIHPNSGKAPNLFLVEGVKCANQFLKVEDPIYVYDEDGNYTKTIKQIYGDN